MGLLQTWRSLDPEQKEILRSKQVKLNRPVDEVLKLLRPLAACDALADQARTRLGCSLAVSIVLAIVGGIFFLSTSNDFPKSITIPIIAAILLIAIALGYFWNWTRRIDVSNNCRQFVVPILTVFREDFDATQPMQLRLDLSPPMDPSKKRSQSDPEAQGAYYKVIESVYVDPWMSAEAMLVDGTKLSWEITDTIRSRRKTKRTARGKIKTKTKNKKKTDLDVTLSLRAKEYEIAGDDVEKRGKRNVVQVQHTIHSESLDPIDPRVMIDMVAEVYRRATPAQKEARA